MPFIDLQEEEKTDTPPQKANLSFGTWDKWRHVVRRVTCLLTMIQYRPLLATADTSRQRPRGESGLNHLPPDVVWSAQTL